MTEENIILINLGILGGLAFIIFLIACILTFITEKIKDRLGWEEWDLTEKQKEELATMTSNEQEHALKRIVNSRKIKWESIRYNRITRVLTIK